MNRILGFTVTCRIFGGCPMNRILWFAVTCRIFGEGTP
jgi:hypothetical protein